LEHKQLSLEVDKNLINKILDDINSRYLILFLYIIRNDLFKNLTDQRIIDVYNLIMSREEVDKGAILSFWSGDFIKTAIDLGLFRNIRSMREFDQKKKDFIVKFGEEIITISKDTILTPAEVLFRLISKKFKTLTKRDFNLALIQLKGLKCESTSVVHPFIYEIPNKYYILSEDLYEILKEYKNIYLAIKAEYTIEAFYEGFKETQDKVLDLMNIFENIIKRKQIIKKINTIFKGDNFELLYQKDENSKNKEEKLKFSEVSITFKIPHGKIKLKLSDSNYQKLINYRLDMEGINERIMKIRKNYSTIKKKYNYLEFINNITKNEKEIQESLIDIRKEIVYVKSMLDMIKNEIKIFHGE